MKRILAIITTLTISWTTFFIVGSEAFASVGGQLVETKPTLSELPSSQKSSYKLYKDLYDELVKKIDASLRDLEKVYTMNRLYYFSLMLDNSLNCSSPVSSGNCFTDEYLFFYFDYLCNHLNWSDGSSVGFFTVCNDDGLITNVQDLKFNTEKLGFFPSNWSGRSILWDLSNPPSYFKDFKAYYNYLYSCYSSDKSPSYGEAVGLASPFISSADFVDAINANTTAIIPSTQTIDRSWKNNPLSVSGYDSKRDITYFPLLVNGDFFGIKDCKDIYGIPYFVCDGVKYYSSNLIHFNFAAEIDANTPSDIDYPVFDISLCLNSFEFDFTRHYISNIRNNFTPYCLFNVAQSSYTSFNSLIFGNSEWYNTGFTMGKPSVNYSSTTFSFFLDSSFHAPIFYSSANIGSTLSSYSFFCGDTSLGIDKPDFTGSVSDKDYNFGFELAYKPFYLGSLSSFLDGSRIPQNSYVTITGDSIYDYSITDSNNGSTTTMGDFINNGYAWLNTGDGTQNNQGGGSGNGSGGGGTISGDINVGGSIDVNVSGGLDINVNVNGGGSGNGGGGNGNSYNFDTDPLNSNLYDATEKSIGIRNFLEEFFSFLPPELLSLLGILFTLVIIKVIFNRK